MKRAYKIYRKFNDGESQVKIIPSPAYNENKEAYYMEIQRQNEDGWRQLIMSSDFMNEVLIKLIDNSWVYLDCEPREDNDHRALKYFELVADGFPFVPEYMELISTSTDVNWIALSKSNAEVTLRGNGVIEFEIDEGSEFDIEGTLNQIKGRLEG